MSKIKDVFIKVKKIYNDCPVRVKASVSFLIASFIKRGISVITTPIFTRIMSTADYGSYSVFRSWLDIATIIISLQICAGYYPQGLVKHSDDGDRMSSSLQGLNMAFALAWSIIFLCFHHFWEDLLSLSFFQCIALILLAWAGESYGFWLREQQIKVKYRAIIAVSLLVSIASTVLELVFVSVFEDKVTARISALLLVEFCVYSALCFSQIKKGKQLFNKLYWKEAILFNLPLVAHYLSQIVLNNSDRIMIKAMVGASEAGIYSLAYSISNLMVLFNTSISQTLAPWSYERIKANREQDITPIGFSSLMLIGGLNLLLIALAPELVHLFAPQSYYSAIWVIPPVAMSAYFLYLYSLFGVFGLYFGKTKQIMGISVFGAVLNIILNYVFINKYGYCAAGYTTLVCYIVYSFGHYLLMTGICKKREIGKSIYNPIKLIIITAIFLFSGFALLLMYPYPIIRYFIVAFALLLCILFRKKLMALIMGILKK